MSSGGRSKIVMKFVESVSFNFVTKCTKIELFPCLSNYYLVEFEEMKGKLDENGAHIIIATCSRVFTQMSL